MRPSGRAEALVLRWGLAYTRGLPPDVRQRRLDELASDCFEQRHWGGRVGASPVAVATSMVARTLAGVPADLSWRQAHLAASRDRSLNPRGRPMGRWMRDNWWVVLAGILGALLVTFGVGLPFEDRTLGSVFGGIVIAACGASMLLGIWTRRNDRSRGDLMIAVGTLPAYPFFWTIVLPVLGLAVMIPALLDRADARATANDELPTPARSGGGNGTMTTLLSVTLAAVVATVAAVGLGETDLTFALVSPSVALLVGVLVARRSSMTGLQRAGLVALVAGIVHGILTAAVIILAEPGSISLRSGLPYVANALMAPMIPGGLVLLVLGARRPRDRARPA